MYSYFSGKCYCDGVCKNQSLEGYMTGYFGEKTFFSEKDPFKENYVQKFDQIVSSIIPSPSLFVCLNKQGHSGIFFDGSSLYEGCFVPKTGYYEPQFIMGMDENWNKVVEFKI